MTAPKKDEGQPIRVDPSISLDMILTGGRQIALVLGGAISLYGFLRSHDISGFGGWLGSELFTIIGAVIAILSFLYGQWRTFWRKHEQVQTAEAAPDKVAIVQPSRFTRFVYGILGRKI